MSIKRLSDKFFIVPERNLFLSNDIFNTVKSIKSNRPLHNATVSWNCVFLVVRKRSMNVGLEDVWKQVPTLTRLQRSCWYRKVLKQG